MLETPSAQDIFYCSDVSLPPEADISVVQVSSSRM